MKTLITSIVTAVVLFFNSTPSNAETRLYNNTTTDNTINWYISSVSKGQTDGLADLFNDTFIQNVSTNGKTVQFTKSQVVDFLKAHKNIKQQHCATSYSMLEEHPDFSIAKVEMKYRDFTKVDYVTLCSDGQGWKVSQVVTVYP